MLMKKQHDECSVVLYEKITFEARSLRKKTTKQMAGKSNKLLENRGIVNSSGVAVFRGIRVY